MQSLTISFKPAWLGSALLCGTVLTGGAGATAQTVVFSDDFEDGTVGQLPTSDFTTNSVEDWDVSEYDLSFINLGMGTVRVADGVGSNTSQVMRLLDEGGGDTPTAVRTDQFAPFSVNDNTSDDSPRIRINFDMNVRSMTSANQFGTRFEVRRTESSFPFFSIGFQAFDSFQDADPDIDGDGEQDLFFGYRSSSSGTEIDTPIGFDAGTGQWWHDFGDFDFGSVTPTVSGDQSDVPENNNTDGWVNVDLLFDAITDEVTGTLTLDTDTTTFVAALPGNVAFSDQGGETGDSIGTFRFRTGNTLESEMLIDNFVVTVEGVRGLIGDYDTSGRVEQGDLDIVLQNWGTGTFPGNEGALVGGGPFDGTVDQNELDGVLQNWGSTGRPDISGASVPEPTGLVPLAAAVALARHRRR